MHATSKEKQGKLYIVGKVNKFRSWKKYELIVFSISQKKIANNCGNDHATFDQINKICNPSASSK